MIGGTVLRQGVLAGAVMFAVGTAFHFLTPLVAPSLPAEYGNTALFRPLRGSWAGLYMLAHPFGYGLVLALAFTLLRGASGGAVRGIRGGAAFGLGVFLVGSLPVYLLNYASFQVRAAVVVSWVVQGLTQYVAAGALLGWAADRRAGDPPPP